MQYHFKLHKEKDGYWAECLELEGCQCQADSLEDLKMAAKDALDIYLSEEPDSKLTFQGPQPSTGKDVFTVEVDPGIALALLIRQTRLKRKLTQHQMKEALGIKNLSNYQRLEDPKRANPELRTIISLIKAFPEIKIGSLLDSYKFSQKKKTG